MGQSSTASAIVHTPERSSDETRTVVDGTAVQELLDAVEDADCRKILTATSENALTANEVSETCDLPLATTYRKLGLLAGAGLVEERTRIRQSKSGKHASEYIRSVDAVAISFTPRGELEVRVSQRVSPERTGAHLLITGD